MKLTSNRRPGQLLSLCVGILAAGAAIYVLTQDYWEGGEFSPLHVLLPIIAIVAIASGKLAYCAMHDRAWANAAGFALLFVFATAAVVAKSVGKQAQTYDAKTSDVQHGNKMYLGLTRDIMRREKALTQAEENVAWEVAGRPKTRGKRDMSGRPTGAKGCGSQCREWQKQALEHRARLMNLRSRLAQLGAFRKADAEAEHWADLAVAYGLMSATSRTAFSKTYALTAPLLQTLVLELAACWCLGFAFYTRTSKTARPDVKPDVPTIKTYARAHVPGRRDTAAIAYIQDYRSKKERNPPIRHISNKFEMPRSTAHRYIKDYA